MEFDKVWKTICVSTHRVQYFWYEGKILKNFLENSNKNYLRIITYQFAF